MKTAGFEIRIDPRVPEDEIWFEHGGIRVAKITGFTCPSPWYRRLYAWLRAKLA